MEFEHRGRSLNIFDMSEILDDNQLPTSQQVAVTDVAVSEDGALVACALDNGMHHSIRILRGAFNMF